MTILMILTLKYLEIPGGPDTNNLWDTAMFISVMACLEATFWLFVFYWTNVYLAK